MIFTKSSNKVISLLLAIALVLTMFVTVAPTNVLATGASGNVGESGTVGESSKILINLKNVKTRPTEASGLEEKEGYEWFVVGQPIPTLSVSDFENYGEGSENVHIDRVEVDVWNGTSWITATGTVEADKLYRVSVVVLANDGYQLYLTSGPLDAGYNTNYFYASVNENKEIVTIADNFFYRNTALSPKYEAGVTIPSIKENEVIVIDDDVYSFPYSVREGKIKFMESTKVENDMRYWGDVTTSTFVQGKTYAMTFVLEPADGYTFNCGTNLGWVNGDGTFTIVWNLGVCP
ncbi:MAG: hypothetical protein IJC83_00590, partial [Oscillospiraceae bacterium]|nr:hypothetical protein [Oscillospiraceae bacterium]